MEVIKTIFKLSFFLLGCVMLMLALLVIPVGFKSISFFLAFSIVFYLLSISYTTKVIKYIFSKIAKIRLIHLKVPKLSKVRLPHLKLPKISIKRKPKDSFVKLNKNIVYNEVQNIIKLNSKEYKLEQLCSVDLILNANKITIKELKKEKNIKKLEIKVGIKVKKITYRNFKYIAKKSDLINKKDLVKQAICDYKELEKVCNK